MTNGNAFGRSEGGGRFDPQSENALGVIVAAGERQARESLVKAKEGAR